MEKIQKSKLISIQTTTSKDILENVSNHKNANPKESPFKPTDQSIGLELTETNRKHIEIEEISSPISPLDQSVVLCHILEHNFSLFEQIEMRRVCRLWHDSVEHIWGKARSLVLSLDDCTNKPTLSAKHKRNFEFEYYFEDSQTINNDNMDLTIGQNHWNQPTIDLLGDLFRNIEHLTIFYELSCDFEATEKLCNFLHKYPKIKSFSLIIPVPCHVKMDILFRLFKMINTHLAQLHTLHLYLPKFNLSFPALKSKHFHRILSFLQNFSLNCAVGNLGEMLKTMGKSLHVCLPMQSLSINVGHEKSLSPVSTLFEQNPRLSQIKRLELSGFEKTKIKTLNLVFGLLNHFTELEGLYLWADSIKFTIKWIQTLSKLPHLTELYLWDFKIQTYEVKPLPNIRKLTVVLKQGLQYVRDRYYRIIGLADDEDVEERLIYAQFLHSFAKQFPSLEQLSIQIFVDLHDEHFSDWCFTEFRHLRTVRLIDYKKDSTFTSKSDIANFLF